ncbi:Htur_1727 family rSAM-partnered candidate RiPP [Natronorubrum aibiense]|uniref:RSAM-partnered protein n=1 Tax=Natronorubrum aibiense TaxID=348826 RepID=A0A5P9P7A3_9EURY|nr:Htur_1727 family rSAM-partnered candidate RiPP [Natronorubrum aibiense]QFU83827.1 rSAM-partnered protein [Natronorubrum aibiense]
MVETSRLERVETDERANPEPQWELFVRETEDGPLKHVGSVAAANAATAYEHASTLFGESAVDLWLCPAAEVERYSTRGLAAETTDAGERREQDRPLEVSET